ncbi:MAG: WD40 repeat domain-containing protein [Myxococcota bacterium]|nr:WD40 repeat domain-containing protein [Myxococcota bacterium]
MTSFAVGLALLALLVPFVGSLLGDIAWFLLEIVGRILDRPTWLVVLGYALVGLSALGLERRRRQLGRLLPLWQILCFVGLLGQGYVLALAWMLRPTWLLVAIVALVGLAIGLRSFGSGDREAAGNSLQPLAPIVGLFVLIHLLVEGVAGHILTPWVGRFTTGLSALSRDHTLVYWPIVLLGASLPLALLLRLLRQGLPPINWLHPDLRRCVDALALPSLVALSVVLLHYGTTVIRCPPTDAAGLRLLSSSGGIFDLEASEDSTLLAVSHREQQVVEFIDLASGTTRGRVGTAHPADTLFDHTEPETLLALPEGRFLLLVASSDSEQGNMLTIVEPSTGSLSAPLAATGVSDVVGDGEGGVWVSNEFGGQLARLDPGTGEALVPFSLPGGAETNKVIVDAGSNRAWSAGLWSDPLLRLVDLDSGRQLASTELGTHQWDLALCQSLRRVFVPRLVAGEIRVLDADSLEHVMRIDDDFGLRPIEVSPDGARVVTGNVYTGEVVGRSAQDGSEEFRRRIGGYIKGLELAPDGRIFAGSTCGTYEILP